VSRPLVIGHRGFRARFPENRVAGVRAALAAGADGVEVDVRLSRDGIWVCHHDVEDHGVRVADQRWATLRGQAVATLEDVLAEVPGDRWLFLEIKPLPADELKRGGGELARLISPRASLTRVLSSSEAVLAAVRDLLPACPRSLVFRDIPDDLHCRDRSLSPFHRRVERLLATGCELHPWTVNRPGRILTLARFGVASITSDDPELALEILSGR